MSSRIKNKVTDPTLGWQLSYWNQLLVLMFGQLDGCRSLRELTDIAMAHKEKSFHLGFGKYGVNRSILSKCNSYRDWHVFEEFAYHMINMAQRTRIGREFCIEGKFYAFDSSTIDLCMSIFKWANFRSTKSGIKLHTQLDIVTQIPKMVHITEARTHDVNAMDVIEYEPQAGYIFDRGYWDLCRLYHINQVNAFFVIREKRQPEYAVETCVDIESNSNVLKDESVRFIGERNVKNYPDRIRRLPFDENGEKRCLVGGSGIAHNDMLILTGGVNYKIFNNAINGKAPNDYLKKPVEWYKFNDDILFFNLRNKTWNIVKDVNGMAKAGGILLEYKNSLYMICGETKPGIRSSEVITIPLSHIEQ